MITLKNISLRRGSKLLLDAVDLSIQPGEKIALIGRNGAGKSSLFALLSGELHEDSGDFSLPASWQMAQVAQHLPDGTGHATDFVLGGDSRLMAAQAKLHEVEAQGDGEAIAHAHTALLDAGSHDATARAQALILGLGFRPDQLNAPVGSFSGGWQMRLQLARALMCPSDVLLLDEPTNHLDLDALVWLEQWLARYSGTLIVISHDREFLDACTQVTVHLADGQLTRYSGNYSAFERQRAEQLQLQQASYAKQQDKIAHLQRFIDRFKAKATKAKQAQSRIKALERMEAIAPVLAQRDFVFEFRAPEQLPNPMLSLQNASLGYGSSQILRGVSRSVLAGQRIGILGANGQGKSTLVKTIVGALPLCAGEVVNGNGLRIGYFAQQELDVLHTSWTPLEHLLQLAKSAGPEASEQELRNFLGSFLFAGDMMQQAVGSMSGGEKARLVLALLVWQKPNLLLLDEPTNHLDLATRDALALALNSFEGSLLLVSHDRTLLRSTCDQFWLVGQGQVRDFDGDLDDYQRYLLDHAKAQREAAKQQRAGSISPDDGLSNKARRAQEQQLKQERLAKLRPLKKALAELDARLSALGAEQSELHHILSDNPAPEQIAEASRRLAQVDAQLEQTETEWLETSTAIETLGD